MPSEFEARRRIVEIGRRIWQRGYVAANDGNLSIRIDRDRLIVTPTGRSKGFLEPQDLVVVNLRGEKLSGALEPTSEMAMHLFAYSRREDVGAVVHAHPVNATGFAVAGVPLAQCILPEVILSLGSVPLGAYATPSTHEVASSIEEFIGEYNAMLLRNHGVLTLGRDIFEAYYRLETVEHFASIALIAKTLGGASPLSDEDVRKLLHVREKLGITGGTVCLSCGACDGAGVPPEPSVEGGAATDTTPSASPPTPPNDKTTRPEGAPELDAGISEEEVILAVLRKLKESANR